MSNDRGESRPKIDGHGLDRIGRGLREMYTKAPQDPLPASMQLALRSIEDADHGLTQSKTAAHALRAADETNKAPVHVPLWQGSSGALRRLSWRRR